MNLREMDRRVAKRAWARVRRPALPAWAWLLIDLAVVMLVTAALGELVGLGNEDVGQVVTLVGFAGALAVAIYNFVRTTTRSEGGQPGAEGSALRPSGARSR